MLLKEYWSALRGTAVDLGLQQVLRHCKMHVQSQHPKPRHKTCMAHKQTCKGKMLQRGLFQQRPPRWIRVSRWWKGWRACVAAWKKMQKYEGSLLSDVKKAWVQRGMLILGLFWKIIHDYKSYLKNFHAFNMSFFAGTGVVAAGKQCRTKAIHGCVQCLVLLGISLKYKHGEGWRVSP